MRILALSALLAGCAFSEDTPEIKYAPSAASPIAQAQPVGITVIDGRIADRNRISTKINGYGMEAAAIRPANDIVDVVRQALKTEFEQRGFPVDAGGRIVRVTVSRFYNQFHIALFKDAKGDVDLAVTVTDPNGSQLYSQHYAGRSSLTAVLANGSNAAESVATALRDAISKMFADPSFVASVTVLLPPTKPAS